MTDKAQRSPSGEEAPPRGAGGSPGAGAEGDAQARIPTRRFATWRELHRFLIAESRDAARRHQPLHLFVPDAGAAGVLEDALGPRLRGAPAPFVGAVSTFLGDRVPELEAPFRVAPALTREVLLEEAILREAATPGAPPGEAGRAAEALTGPLLAFLEEQAADRRPDPDRPAYRAFVARARRVLTEAAETDHGAGRLLGLAQWLERVVSRYRRALGAVERTDGDGLRRALLAEADSLRPGLAGWRAIAVGEDAARPAEIEVLAALLPAGALSWALVADSPDPDSPDDASVVPTAPRSLFDPALAEPPKSPVTLVPEEADRDAGFVFRRSDREEEARFAARLLRAQRDADPAGASGAPLRLALAAQNPREYRSAVESALADFGFALETRLRPGLAEAPWVASVGAALRFGAQPGRISLGLRMLRDPFFRDHAFDGEPPPRAADLLERELADRAIRDTHPIEELAEVADRLRKRAGRLRRRSAESGAPERLVRRAEAATVAADAMDRLLVYADELAPLRADGGFREALRALRGFLESRLRDPEPGDEAVRDAVFAALDQAREAVPAETLTGGGEAFAARVRRLLERRRLPAAPQASGATAPRQRVHLIAARDAPYGDWDGLVLLGMVDVDWPGPRPSNIFFPARLLEPATRSRQARGREREIALLRALPTLPRRFAAFTRPELHDAFPAGVSPFEVELEEAIRKAGGGPVGFAPDEARPAGRAVKPLPTTLDRIAPSARVLEEPLSATALDVYLRNPAQFFAGRVLGLPEERPLSDVPAPTDRGSRLHDFLEKAFRSLRESGETVSETTLERVLELFRREFAAFRRDAGIPDAEALAEERWLFGGEATPGAIEWYLREEAARGPADPVAFEAQLEGELEPALADLPALRVRGRLDRLDELEDGTLRVVEYKSGRPYEKPVQARLYARLIGKERERPTGYAIPYFGGRTWVGPEDRPNDEEQDQLLRDAHRRLGAGDFRLPPESGKFDYRLVCRTDLPDPPPADEPATSEAEQDA